MNLEKIVNIFAIVLLLGLAVCALMVMQNTAESNVVTTQAAVHQANKESTVAKEVRMLTTELKNLQKDMDEVKRQIRRSKRNGWKKQQGK